MRKTIFRQFLTYMLLFGIALSVVSYVLIEFLFDDYYYSQQAAVLRTEALSLRKEYDEYGLAEFMVASENLKSSKSISSHLYNTSTNELFGSDMQSSGRQNIMEAFASGENNDVFISTTGGQNSRINWLTLIISTDDGNLIMARISYANMDSVVAIVQQFFLFFGLFLAIAFIVFAFFFSRSMSQPLKKLNDIAEKMGNLDFTLRYSGNRRDEIGLLGETLNTLTASLENTISQLKGELEKEKTLEKMRTGFTAQVSHELQTPLSVIKGYAEALSDRLYESDELDEVYEIMLSETDKISRLVDDLLDLSQMESGAFIIRKKNFSLSDLLNKLYNTHKNLPHDKPFEFYYKNACTDGSLFFGDPLRIEQALGNILRNASKHVDKKGKILINLSSDNDSCIISIFNSGDTIPEEDLSEIFKSYYQGKNNKGGTGLGLTITKHIIQLHGGTISAINHSGGVEILITLPKFG